MDLHENWKNGGPLGAWRLRKLRNKLLGNRNSLVASLSLKNWSVIIKFSQCGLCEWYAPFYLARIALGMRFESWGFSIPVQSYEMARGISRSA
jgi:hypothetical protein